MRCLTVSNGTVTEESKLRFPDDVTLRNVAPGNHSGMYLTNWDESSTNQCQSTTFTYGMGEYQPSTFQA